MIISLTYFAVIALKHDRLENDQEVTFFLPLSKSVKAITSFKTGRSEIHEKVQVHDNVMNNS